MDWLQQLDPARIRLGLERVERVYRAMGQPRPAPLILTIAGTNGKGSCVALLESILSVAGWRVGAYTSPHLLRFNERLRVGRVDVSDEDWCRGFDAVNAARADVPLTYFEWVTLAAMAAMAEADLEVAILEVGLGGRLDAVNVIGADGALISSIDLDHMTLLGRCRESIGVEKAGVLRAGQVAVCGDRAAPRSIEQQALRIGSIYFQRGNHFTLQSDSRQWHWLGPERKLENLPWPAIPGAVQLDNAAACLMLLEGLGILSQISPSALAEGLRLAALPARLQVVSVEPEMIVDVAHNAAACTVLAAWLAQRPCQGRTLVVFGLFRDKEAESVVAALAPQVDLWFCATLSSPRTLPATELGTCVSAAGGKVSATFDNVEAALEAALKSSRPIDRVVVCGSFLCATAALRRFG